MWSIFGLSDKLLLKVVISTGKSDWQRSVTSEHGSLASYLAAIEEAAPTTHTGFSTPGTLPGTPSSTSLYLPSAVAGIFRDSETHAVSILNGSHDTLSKDHDHESVLIFPDYKVVAEVPRSLNGARDLWRNSVNPSVPRPGLSSGSSAVNSWVIPYACVILICECTFFFWHVAVSVLAPFRTEPWRSSLTGSHRRRDARCAIVAPKLEYGEFCSRRGRLPGPLIGRHSLSAFSESLEREGWEVHTQLDNPTGPPLEEYADGDEKESELNRRLQELDHEPVKRALIIKTSHIGGHRYAGNVIVGLSPLVKVELGQC
jgi:hypothetical protein